MAWNTSHVFWREQLMILSILLPPIFISIMFLALFGPRFFAFKQSTPREKEALRVSTRSLPESQ